MKLFKAINKQFTVHIGQALVLSAKTAIKVQKAAVM